MPSVTLTIKASSADFSDCLLARQNRASGAIETGDVRLKVGLPLVRRLLLHLLGHRGQLFLVPLVALLEARPLRFLGFADRLVEATVLARVAGGELHEAVLGREG